MPRPDDPRTSKATIDVAPGGPYLVHDIEAVRNSRGEDLEVKATLALCRCGGSASKPFCDGTHKRNGFTGANLADPAKRSTRDYVGEHVTIHDRRWVCSHAAECVQGLPEVWRKDGKPWIVPDAGTAQEIVDVVRRCPSGALTYSIDGVEVQEPPKPRAACIVIDKNGPYRVTGAPTLQDQNGVRPPVGEHYTLCRCGHSRNKPFCDGSHAPANFVDDAN